MQGEIRYRTITGVGWSAVSQAVTQSFTFVISIVLARLLGPKAYGLIGMVAVFTGFVVLFSGLGFGAAIIQRKELERRHLDSAFWLNVIMGCGMALLMCGLAPLVARFYGEPALTLLTAAISLRFVVDALNVVQIALLTRVMNFRALAAVQIGSSVVGGFVGLGMAVRGSGVWSLVAQTLASSVTQLILAWKLANWRPQRSFEFRACKELFGFSASMLAFDTVNYWARNLDQLLIGRFLGAGALGIYSRAYALMLMPLNQVTRVMSNVLFPALSAIQDDKPRVKRAYVKSLGVIAFITFPMMVGLFAIADHFVLALLGVNWAETIPILRLFCWVGLIQSVCSTVGCIYTSQGKTKMYLTMGIIGTGACALSFVIGIHWGIMGVAWAYAITNAVVMFPFFEVPGRLIGLSFVEAAKSLRGTFFCSLAMGAIVWSAGRALPTSLLHWHHLVIQVPLGIVTYLLLVAGLNLHTWQEVRRVLTELLTGRLKPLTESLGRRSLQDGSSL